MKWSDKAFFLVTWLVFLIVAVVITAHRDRVHTRTFTDSQLRVFVTEQAECHAEFFYTHDPSITGVGIDEAVKACLGR